VRPRRLRALLGGPSTSPLDIMKHLLLPALMVAAILLVALVIRSRMAPQIRVTVTDIPRIINLLSTSSRAPAFAVLMFNTADRPNAQDALNLQFSMENGRVGLDWVLLGPRNIEDKDALSQYIRRRGYSYSEETQNKVTYLRIEDGDLAQLGDDIITKFYALPRTGQLNLIAEGFAWTS